MKKYSQSISCKRLDFENFSIFSNNPKLICFANKDLCMQIL